MAESDKEAPKKNLSAPEAIERLKLIQQGLAELVYSLHENIQALDDDPDFQESLESLQDDAEKKARDLESEVKRLRNDIKSIKDVLDEEAEKRKPTES